MRRLHDLSPSEIADVSEFYWNTNISVSEIQAAYDIVSVRETVRVAGHGTIQGMTCCFCAGPVRAASRLELKVRMDRFFSDCRRLADWAQPDACADCAKRLRDESNRAFRLEQEAREARSRALRKMPYKEYLRTPEWQETRSEALRRSRYKCSVCASGSNLDVHHRTYIRRGNEYASDLTVLCRRCHSTFHEHGFLAERGRAA